MNTKQPKIIAKQFNDCINRRDLAGLARLMTEDHTFIDRGGTAHHSKSQLIREWKQFFEMFPDYRNTITRIEARNDLILLQGSAYWSEKEPQDAVIWTVKIVNDLVQEWRIYADTESNRRSLNYT